MTDASSKIDLRRLKVGDLLLKILVQRALVSCIPCSRSVVISVRVTRQRRHLARIQCVFRTRLPQVDNNFSGCIAKNARSIAMRMNKPYNKTPQLQRSHNETNRV